MASRALRPLTDEEFFSGDIQPKTDTLRPLTDEEFFANPKKPAEQAKPETISGFVQKHINPAKFPVIQGLEDLGQKVKDVAGKSFENVAERPLPNLGKFQVPAEVMRKVASNIGKTAIQAAPFTPSEFAIAAGAELAPVALTPKKIAPKMGKAYMENSIPSSPSEIRHAEKFADKDAADLVLERPQLGNSRDAILENSKRGISSIEKQVQDKLNQAVKAGKINKGTLPEEPSLADQVGAKGGTLPPVQLPGSGKVPQFGEFPEGSSTGGSTAKGGRSGARWLDPGEQGLQTKGRPFKKGGAKGVFDPGEADVLAKQNQYIKEDIQGNLQKIKDDFKARASTPEYMGLKKEYAIGKDEIATAFDDVAKQMRTGTEKSSIDALNEIKSEFLDFHPKYGDVHYWNDIKRAIYKLIGDKGYLAQTPSAKVQALKAVANKIKGRISDIVPGLDKLNNEQGALLDIRDAIIQSSPREVRDTRFLGPIRERAAIMGARTMAKPRVAVKGGGILSLPLSSMERSLLLNEGD